MVVYRTSLDPIKVGDPGSNVKITVTLFPFFTPPRNRGGVIYSLQFVCVCVSVCVCVCVSVCVCLLFSC